MAAIGGLKSLKDGEDVLIYSDSSYMINGITKWIQGWKRSNWKTKTKDDVMNKDLWMELDEQVRRHRVSWKYIGGHIGIAGNERCDTIATAFADQNDIKLYSGSLSEYPIQNILDISYDEEDLKQKKSSSSKSKVKAFSYVSAINGQIQVHHSWPECEKRVKGARGARYKKAISKADEEAIVKEFSS